MFKQLAVGVNSFYITFVFVKNIYIDIHTYIYKNIISVAFINN